MTYHIVTPTRIESPLYESELEFTESSIVKAVRSGYGSAAKVHRTGRPVISIGQPQVWSLVDLAREKGQPLPAELSLLLRDAEFYLVLLGCSFRLPPTTKVKWARFSAFLRPKNGTQSPIAFDLYPREVTKEVQVPLKVSIGPSLKFSEVELSVGQVVADIRFDRLEPIIVAGGQLQPDPSWNFEEYRSQPILGGRFLYLIVKKPRDAEAVRLSLDLAADVHTKHGLLSATIKETDRDHVSCLICA